MTCLSMKIADLSEDQHTSTPSLLVAAQVQLSSHMRSTISAATQLTAAVRNIAQSTMSLSDYITMSHQLPSCYSTVLQYCTIYQAAIAYTVTFTSCHTITMLYGTTISLPKVHCILLLHQTAGNPSNYCHITTGRVDCSIRKGHPHLDHHFKRIWPKSASRIRI
jgi:hypothetical protein